MEIGGIYRIRCLVNNKVYIGSAKNFEWRWGSHLYELRKGTHVNPHLQRSFYKHGEENFAFEIIEQLGEYDKDLYFERENVHIEEALKSGNCYNIAKAEGGWTHHTTTRKAEIRAKVSDSLRKTMSLLTDDERREKYGKHQLGTSRSPELRAKISSKLLGIPKSEETRKKMSEARHKLSDEDKKSLQQRCRKIGLSNKGKAPPNKKKVKVDEHIFDSLKDAAIFLESSSSALCRAIKNGKFKHHKIMYLT